MSTHATRLLRLPFAASLALAACSGSTPEATPKKKADTPAEADPMPAEKRGNRASVVLVTMDTTRADHIGAYGHTEAHTPTVDAMASQGLRFERAYAVVPLTTPSHASMLSGLYPTRHGIHNNGDAILGDDVTTLAEQLKKEGYHTGASIAAFVTTRIWNLDQGFDAYFDDVGTEKDRRQRGKWARERRADSVVDDAIAWVEKQPPGEPLFLWVHFYDPHDPYAPPKEWAEKLEGRPYDGEIAFMDSQIARLQEVVEKRQGEAGTGWVLVADHGEALEREHGEHTHGMFVFDPTMRIPFIVRPPKPLAEGKVESAQTVSNVDVTPTVLGMLDLPVMDDLDGKDLSSLLASQTVERDPVYMEAESASNRFGFAPERAVAHGPLKLIDTPSPRLFDVVADPAESVNLIDKRPDEVTRLKAVTEQILSRRIDVQGGAASPEVLAQLEALGYMSAEAGVGNEDTAKLDAKDHRDLIMKLERARHQSRRKPKKALALYEEIIAAHPQISEARMALARIYARQNRHDKAVETLEAALELQPLSTVLKSALSNAFAAKGDFEKAEALLLNVLEQVPGDDTARNQYMRLLLNQAKMDEAFKLASQWNQEDPRNLSYDAYLGIILSRVGRLDEAVPYLERSLKDDMPRAFVHSSLAMVAISKGQLEDALEHLLAESEWFPEDTRTRTLIAQTLMRLSRWEEAAAEFKYIATVKRRAPRARLGWAQAVFNAGDYPGAAKVLEPAFKNNPKDPDIMLLQANILQKLGKEEEGKALFEEAKALHELRMEEQRATMQGIEEDAGDFPLPAAPDKDSYLSEYTIPE
jgi:arylsulfatase A-like enzyme/Tfp pilus assembly protein PilF